MFRPIFCCLPGFFLFAYRVAAGATPSPTVPSTGMALGIGDEITVVVDVSGLTKVGETAPGFFAPAGTTLRIDNVGDGTFYVHEVGNGPFGLARLIHFRKCPAAIRPRVSAEAVQPIKCNTEYEVKEEVFKTHAINAAGVEYGILVVPYKFHFSDDSLTPGGTVGAYVGAHFSPFSGETASFVISAGLGAVSVTSTSSNGPATSRTEAALTIALGPVFTLTKSGSFQFGILVGTDLTANSSGYRYNGKPWLALSFGSNLTH